MFRSQDMKLNQLIFAKESVWDTFNFLADTEEIMFAEHHHLKQGPLSDVQNYSLQKTKHFEDLLMIVSRMKKTMNDYKFQQTNFTQSKSIYYSQLDHYMLQQNIRGDLFHLSFEKQIKDDYEKLKELINNQENIQAQRNFILDKINGLQHLDRLITYDLKQNLMKANSNKKIFNIFGSIRQKDEMKIRKLLFRIVRENIIIRTLNIGYEKDVFVEKYFKQQEKRAENKTLIFILLPNMQQQKIIQSIQNILKLYEFESLEDILNENLSRETLIEELSMNAKILEQLDKQIDQLLQDYSRQSILPGQSYIHVMELIFQREKKYAIQMMDVEERKGFYQTKIWVPSSKIEKFSQDLENIRINDINFTKPQMIPYLQDEMLITQERYKVPTKFNFNTFIYPFQELVNTYGVPIYKEANPALFTTVTFPFQFGVMFGDIGHGILLLLFSLTLFSTFQHVEVLNQIKYMFLMMSIFSIFCGFIYNDFFGYPLLIFDTCYDNFSFQRKSNECVYPLGLDWIWNQSENETSFINSFKMKFSIIVGVIHMLLGIFMKILNSFYFKKKIDFIFEALPQFIFMIITFGYMSFCIVVKWLQNWDDRESISIISLFINFTSISDPLYSTQDFQQKIHSIILILSFICIFMMLLPKPIILYYQQKKKYEELRSKSMSVEAIRILEEDSKNFSLSQIEEQDSFGELFVHQMIEAIEFILGSVSNTASYLRLWALSLAHNQLARVFLSMIFGWTIQTSDSIFMSLIVILLGFVFWFVVTLAVIMLMDLMECFLHALRLHWVEFQNKFFKGEGIVFKPFTKYYTEQNNFIYLNFKIFQNNNYFQFFF